MLYPAFHEVTNGGDLYALICVRNYCTFAEEYAETDGILLQEVLYVVKLSCLGNISFLSVSCSQS